MAAVISAEDDGARAVGDRLHEVRCRGDAAGCQRRVDPGQVERPDVLRAQRQRRNLSKLGRRRDTQLVRDVGDVGQPSVQTQLHEHTVDRVGQGGRQTHLAEALVTEVAHAVGIAGQHQSVAPVVDGVERDALVQGSDQRDGLERRAGRQRLLTDVVDVTFPAVACAAVQVAGVVGTDAAGSGFDRDERGLQVGRRPCQRVLHRLDGGHLHGRVECGGDVVAAAGQVGLREPGGGKLPLDLLANVGSLRPDRRRHPRRREREGQRQRGRVGVVAVHPPGVGHRGENLAIAGG